jgi:hypothetical protein
VEISYDGYAAIICSSILTRILIVIVVRMNAVIVIAMDVKWVDVDEKQLKNIIQNI